MAASRKRGRRGRSRKRRPVAASATELASPEEGRVGVEQRRTRPPKAPSGKRARERARGGGDRTGSGFRDPQSVGERPQAPWHPLPLSELLILAGAIGTVVGLRRGASNGGPTLFAGLGAVVIGTAEVTLREHLSGYRSHTIILSLLPVIALDTAIAFGLAAFITPVPLSAKVALFGLDVPLLAFLYKLLRARFLDARRERTFRGRR